MAELKEAARPQAGPFQEDQRNGLTPGDRIAIASFTGAAVALFSLRLGTRSLSLDEGVSWGIAQLPWSGFWHTITTRQANMGLYYLVLRGWLHLFDSQAGIRALSVVPAAGTFPFVYAIGRSMFGRRVAIVACTLLLVNAYFLGHAQQARAYALVVFLVTAASFFLTRYVRDKRSRDLVIYGVLGVLSVYAHLFGAFVLIAHAISLGPLLRRRIDWRSVTAAYVAMGIAVSPLVWAMTTNNIGQIDWITRPTAGAVAAVLSGLVGGTAPLALIVYGLLFLSVSAVAVRPALRLAESSQEAWPYLFVLAWAIVPIALSLIISVVAQPIFLERYLVVSLPALTLGAAVGVVRLRPAVLIVAIAALMATVATPGLLSYYKGDESSWRVASAYVLDHARRGDALVFYYPSVRWPFQYYLHHSGGQDGLVLVYPPASWLVFGHYRTTALPSPHLAEQLASRFDRVWIIVSHDNPKEPLRELDQQLRRAFTREGRSFRTVQIRLYVLTEARGS